MAQDITLQHGAQDPSSVTRSGPGNTLCHTCTRKPTALPSRGRLSTVCLPFQATPLEAQVPPGGPPGVQGPCRRPRTCPSSHGPSEGLSLQDQSGLPPPGERGRPWSAGFNLCLSGLFSGKKASFKGVDSDAGAAR